MLSKLSSTNIHLAPAYYSFILPSLPCCSDVKIYPLHSLLCTKIRIVLSLLTMLYIFIYIQVYIYKVLHIAGRLFH